MILEQVAQEKIINELKLNCNDPENIYRKLIISNKETSFEREYRNRLNLAKLYRRNSQLFDSDLDLHLKKYSWVASFLPWDAPLTRNKLLFQVKEMDRRKDEDLISRGGKNNLDLSSLSKSNKELVKVMKQNSWARTYRRELMTYSFFALRGLYQAIAKSCRVDFNSLKYVACWEVPGILAEKIDISKNIYERKKDFVLISYKGKYIILDGNDVNNFNIRKGISTDQKALYGMQVYPGSTTGLVQIIKSRSDLTNIRKGCILVTPTVATWMTPIIEKCLAIITDEGGMLSHTAIVAREYKIPCIVGTKIATKVFKHGDLVEVDANNGIVRKVNQ